MYQVLKVNVPPAFTAVTPLVVPRNPEIGAVVNGTVRTIDDSPLNLTIADQTVAGMFAISNAGVVTVARDFGPLIEPPSTFTIIVNAAGMFCCCSFSADLTALVCVCVIV